VSTRWITPGASAEGILRTLTETAKAASEEALNKNFAQRFHDECKKRHAPKVELDFPGRQGQVTRRKTLTSAHRLNTVLSEGEQKVIALADLRNICEIIVEKELLAGVTERYEPNVRMTRLPEIKADRLQAAIAVIQPIYEDCCRYIASHSQPLETLNVRPTLDDLKRDWTAVQDALAAYKA
jgi:hypothetical protein